MVISVAMCHLWAKASYAALAETLELDYQLLKQYGADLDLPRQGQHPQQTSFHDLAVSAVRPMAC